MSVIYASVKDQVLRITEAPTIASGGKDEVKISFTFCEKWDGFANTAVFSKNESNIQMIIDRDDICLVPWEVCNEPGTFYISVFGNKGETTRTTTRARYKVKQGAPVEGDEPSEPTQSVYEQIMSEVAAVRSEQENFIEDAEAAVNASVEVANKASDNANQVAQELTEAMARGDFDGKDGNDYVLTEKDKEDIAEMAAEMVDVPGSGGNVDLTGYATEQFVRDGFQPKGEYLTEHQDLTEYAKKSEIPSIEGLATEEYVDQFGAQCLNEVNDMLKPYALKKEIPAVPANVSAFTNDAGYQTAAQVESIVEEAISDIPTGGGGGEFKRVADETLAADVTSWAKTFDKAYKKFRILIYAFSGANVPVNSAWLEVNVGQGKRYLGKSRYSTGLGLDIDILLADGYLLTTCKTTSMANANGAIADVGWKLVTTTTLAETNSLTLYGDAYLKTGARIVVFAEESA